jgi:hypothetical protein
MTHIHTLVAGRWFCELPARSTLWYAARRGYGEQPQPGEMTGGVCRDQAERRSLASVFAQHFHERSLAELPLN